MTLEVSVGLHPKTKSIAKRLFPKRGKKLNTDLVSYRGVTVSWLSFFFNNFLEQEMDADLYVCTKTMQGCHVNRTFNKISNGLKAWGGDQVSVSSQQLQSHFRKKKRSEWTIADINRYVVVPATTVKNVRFYTELLEPHQFGKAFQGCYLIVPRAAVFSNVVKSLAEYCANQGTSPDATIVFLDSFGSNQHLWMNSDSETRVVDMKAEMISHQLQKAIARFDKTIAFVDSLINPNILRRSWSAWELFCAAQSCKIIDIVTDSNQEKEFLDALMDNPYSISRNLTEFDIRDTLSYNPTEKKMMIETITSEDTVNATIKHQVRKLLIQSAEKSVTRFHGRLATRERLRQEKVYSKAGRCCGFLKFACNMEKKKSGLPSFQVFLERMLRNASLLVQKHASLDKGLELYLHVHSIFFKLYIFEEDEESEAYNQLRKQVGTLNKIILDQIPRHEKSGADNLDLYRVYRQSLQVFAEAHGEKCIDVGRMFNNLGRLAAEDFNWDNAVQLFSQARSILEDGAKADIDDLGYSLHMLATCLLNEGNNQKGLTVLEELTEILEQRGGQANFLTKVTKDLELVAVQFPEIAPINIRLNKLID